MCPNPSRWIVTSQALKLFRFYHNFIFINPEKNESLCWQMDSYFFHFLFSSFFFFIFFRFCVTHQPLCISLNFTIIVTTIRTLHSNHAHCQHYCCLRARERALARGAYARIKHVSHYYYFIVSWLNIYVCWVECMTAQRVRTHTHMLVYYMCCSVHRSHTRSRLQ